MELAQGFGLNQLSRAVRRDRFVPVCIGSADLMAEDILSLLFYKPFMPHSVMVEC